MPSDTTIHRHRFTLDAALAKMTMAKTLAMLQQGVCGTLLCDSSPRQGREWMFTELFLILLSDLPNLLKHMKEMWRLGTARAARCAGYRSEGMAFVDLDEETQAYERSEANKMKELSGLIQKMIFHHVCIPAVMGAKNLSLAVKFQTVLHSLRIECFDWAHAEHLLRALSSITTDYGTESKLQTVPSFNANHVIPMWNELLVDPKDWLIGRRMLSRVHWQSEFGGQGLDDDTDSEVSTQPSMPDLADADESHMPEQMVHVDHFVPPESFLSFESSVRVPGVEHLTQNALEASCKKLPNWDDWLKTATQIGRFFKGTYYMNMLEDTNFNVPEAQWVLKKLKSDDFCVPYTKRFGSVVQFLSIWVLVRFDVAKFYCPAKWTNTDDEPREGEDEEWVDVSKVTAAVMGEEFGAMAVIIFASNQPVEEIRLFSRGCPCHRHSFMASLSELNESDAHGVEEDTISTYHKRMIAVRKLAGVSHPCAGKGLVLPFFAAGDHEEIMQTARSYQRQLLWRELRGIGQTVRDTNMAAFDKCTDHILYNTSIKMSDFMVLPLKLAGLHHPWKPKAMACAQAAMEQWDSTQAKIALHHPRVRALFDDKLAVYQMRSMVTHHCDIDDLSDLNKHVGPIAVAKANELSVERLHHLGKMAGDLAGNVGPVYVSWALRGSEFESTIDTPAKLAEAADICEELRHPAKLVGAFQLSNNTLLHMQRDLHVAKGGRGDSHRCYSYKAVRNAFYRSDLTTMFARNQELLDHIYEAALARRAEVCEHQADPLARAKDPKSTDLEKAAGFFCKYQMQHLKSVSCEDMIYALPREAEGFLEGLSEVAGATVRARPAEFGPGAGASSRLMVEDTADEMLETTEPEAATSPMICFRLVHLKPAGMKSTNVLTSLRTDHVAVRMYEVRDKDWGQHTLTIASTMERDTSDAGVKLLSLDAFYKLGFAKIASSFVRCSCLPQVTYFFQGVSLPQYCHGAAGRAAVTCLINAGAYPSIGAWYDLPDMHDDDLTATDVSFRGALQEFTDNGLVKRTWGRYRFQITEDGFKYVRKARILFACSRATLVQCLFFPCGCGRSTDVTY